MSTLAYTVSVTFSDSQLADAWLAWLHGGHIADVLAGGATAAEIIEWDRPGPERGFEVRYKFPDRATFTRYEQEHAPRLRAEGLQKFPSERGVKYERSMGMVRGVYSAAT
jgi:hypothetical protein